MSIQEPWRRNEALNVTVDFPFSDHETFMTEIDKSLRRNAPRVAASALGASWTYARIDADAKAFAAGLRDLGLKAGTRVAIKMPNLPQYLVAVLGIMRAGCIVVNVNPLYTARELRNQLNDSGAEAILLLEQFTATLRDVVDHTAIRHVIVTSIGDLYGPVRKRVVDAVLRHVKKAVPPVRLQGAVRYDAFIRRGRKAAFVPAKPEPDSIAFLQYTGGTTGIAKGAVLTQRNLLAASRMFAARLQPALDEAPHIEQPVLLIPLPIYHIFALSICCMGLMRGARMEFIPNPRDLDRFVATMKTVPFHLMIGLNTLYAALLNHKDISKVEFAAARVFVAGGTGTTQGTAIAWKNATGCDILEGWGMTETCGAGTCNPYPARGFNHSIGLPLPGVAIEIRSEDGTALGSNTPGEIWIKGPNVMAGYWKKDEDVARVLDGRGFLATGDIGQMDEQGFIRLIDRKKDMILVSGFNVYPAEIEDVLSDMAGVVESAAIGVPDATTGEAIKLFVVRSTPNLTVEAVRAFCAAHLTNYKRPKQIVFTDELPKSAVGKVLRKELRDR
jgi:long-chain acyl-CoA synthetase